MKLSQFYSKKNSMLEPTCERLAAQLLRMDRAGENHKLAERMNFKREARNLNIKPECKAPHIVTTYAFVWNDAGS